MHTDEIKTIEQRLRDIFKKDLVTKTDVSVGSQLLSRWKYLTKYNPDDTPTLKTKNNENSKR